MQSSKSNVTATTLATRQKKMAEMCSLIKFFIRNANKRKLVAVVGHSICFSKMITVSGTSHGVAFTACRWASSKVQRAAETCDGGPPEFIQLFSLWRKLQQSPTKGHPLCPQVLV